MFNKTPFLQIFILSFLALFLSACISPKDKVERAKLLETKDATQEQLLAEINRYARVNSMRAKIDLKIEDNSFADVGIAEKYKTADGEIVVQRPANILLKVQIPIIKSDVAQMTSDGEKFRVALLQDGGNGENKMFLSGTNNADYSELKKEAQNMNSNGSKVLKENINALANLRPQHFTEAVLVRPTDIVNTYIQSSNFQEEFDISAKKQSPTRWVLRGYYLLDELGKDESGNMKILRRFWFDRVGSVRLARQQIFDAKGEVESDIVYGTTGNLGTSADFANLPLRIEVTRPKEKYKMSLTYQTPESVSIGKPYPVKAFVLENSWGLKEVDLDKKLKETRSQVPADVIPKTATRLQ